MKRVEIVTPKGEVLPVKASFDGVTVEFEYPDIHLHREWVMALGLTIREVPEPVEVECNFICANIPPLCSAELITNMSGNDCRRFKAFEGRKVRVRVEVVE